MLVRCLQRTWVLSEICTGIDSLMLTGSLRGRWLCYYTPILQTERLRHAVVESLS